MSWFKADDGLHAHPKARRARLEAMGLWVLTGTYSAHYKLDGFVPAHEVETWGTEGRRAAKRLVEAGLWNPTEHPTHGPGWAFHDFADYNPSAVEIEADREAARARQARSRENRRAASVTPIRAEVTK